MAGGCARAGYRLAGDDVVDRLCCRHLCGTDRASIALPAPDKAVVIAVGPHDQSADDIYELILAALEIEMPEGECLKPPCCDDLDGPLVDPEAAERIASAIDAFAPVLPVRNRFGDKGVRESSWPHHSRCCISSRQKVTVGMGISSVVVTCADDATLGTGGDARRCSRPARRSRGRDRSPWRVA